MIEAAAHVDDESEPDVDEPENERLQQVPSAPRDSGEYRPVNQESDAFAAASRKSKTPAGIT
ncbi:hypothetical protein ACQP2F_18010 [Actinoplanes sp. CA-030573]|uniref:hypothetical protein n=1 Tax=Actinoplanes sp. CA-030573 TaxID=3239898 RepID=UPI003D8CF7FE